MDFATYLAIAVSVWGGAPDCGTPTIELHDTLVMPIAAEGVPAGQPVTGLAWQDTCQIQLSRQGLRSLRLWTGRKAFSAYLCDLVVHEVGHLKGLDHDDPAMELGHRFRACR
jgi:hypothetical protein